MRIVVIGGTGLIGSQVVRRLGEHGHDAVPASPNSGVNTVTGEGVKEVVQGADVIVDVSNSPSFADDDVMSFFTTAKAKPYEAVLTLENYTGALGDSFQWRVLWRTLKLGFLTTIFTLLRGDPLAYNLARATKPAEQRAAR